MNNNIKGKGLYTQLPPDVQEKLHKRFIERMNMPVQEKMEEIRRSTMEGFILISNALTQIQQDANVKHITD